MWHGAGLKESAVCRLPFAGLLIGEVLGGDSIRLCCAWSNCATFSGFFFSFFPLSVGAESAMVCFRTFNSRSADFFSPPPDHILKPVALRLIF